ncbi:MAG TPA: hypothetical protein VIP46_01585 [Pyrinomonadaceae bacterium]
MSVPFGMIRLRLLGETTSQPEVLSGVLTTMAESVLLYSSTKSSVMTTAGPRKRNSLTSRSPARGAGVRTKLTTFVPLSETASGAAGNWRERG